MADFPVINGRRYSFASAEINLDGQDYTGIKGINYKESLKSEKVRATGVRPVGRTVGEYDSDGDMEMLIQDWAVFRKALSTKNKSYGKVEFDILVHFSEGPDDPVIEEKLVKCRVEEKDRSNTQGKDATMVKVTLSIMWIEEDGDSLFNPTAENAA